MPEVLKNLLYVIYIIVCLALIVVTLLQPSEGQHSAEETYDETLRLISSLIKISQELKQEECIKIYHNLF